MRSMVEGPRAPEGPPPLFERSPSPRNLGEETYEKGRPGFPERPFIFSRG